MPTLKNGKFFQSSLKIYKKKEYCKITVNNMHAMKK